MPVDDSWIPDSATKDTESVTPDWRPLHSELIEGVSLFEVKQVIAGNGVVTELYRKDWGFGDRVEQVFARTMLPGGLSAWHAHANTLDRLFVLQGHVRIVLFDNRPDSSTQGQVDVLRFSGLRPTLLVVPSRVWHGVRNDGPDTALLINVVDHAYCYEDPDHWRLPADTAEIPYRF